MHGCCFRCFLGWVLLSLVFSCKNEGAVTANFNIDDFTAQQGIVYKQTRTPVTPYYRKINVYYLYGLDKDKPKIGREMDVHSGFKVGGPCVVLVHKENDSINYLEGRGTINKAVLERYLQKSSAAGVPFYGLPK